MSEKTFFYNQRVNCPHCHKDIDLLKCHIIRTRTPIIDKRIPLTQLGIVDPNE